jgi:hypothetical protein
MPKTYTVTTTALEEKALRWAECDPQKWLDTVVHHRAKIAMKELYSIELKKALANPDTETLSSNMEEVVLASTELTAKQKNEQLVSVPMPPPEATQQESEAYIEAMGKVTTPDFVADSPRTFLGGIN